jgi:hypothetical protein
VILGDATYELESGTQSIARVKNLKYYYSHTAFRVSFPREILNQDMLLQSFFPSEFRKEDNWKSLPLTKALLEKLSKNYVTTQQTRQDDDDAIITLDLILMSWIRSTTSLPSTQLEVIVIIMILML